MGLFSPNPAKLKKIELQNLLFDTNEKKLMVSNEFLNDMTTNYVSKRMRNINKMTNGLVTTKNPKNFFTYCDVIDHDIEELIKIEKYHTFKEPVPSEFKKMLAEKMDKYITSMINRTWRDVCQKIGLSTDGKRDPRFYGPVLEELLNYKDKYTTPQLDLIDKFYISVYDISFRMIPEKPEIQEPEEETETMAGSETPDTDANDVPEDGLVLEGENDSAENGSAEENMEMTE